MKIFLAGLFAALALLSPVAVQAQEPSQIDLDAAKVYFEQAQIEYNNGNYEAALELYKKAYALAKKPTILFNIGQCHRKLGSMKEAADSYKQFIKDDPETQYRGEVEYKIAELEEQHLNNPKSALEYYKAYLTHKLDTDPNEATARAKIEALEKELGLTKTPIGPTSGPIDNPPPTKTNYLKFVGPGMIAAGVGLSFVGLRKSILLGYVGCKGKNGNNFVDDVNGVDDPNDNFSKCRKQTMIFTIPGDILWISGTALTVWNFTKNKEKPAPATIGIIPSLNGGLVTFTVTK